MSFVRVQPRCRHCDGPCIERDEDGWRCMWCARSSAPVVSTAVYLGHNEPDIEKTIERERHNIDAAVAAGRRAWS